MAQDQNETEPVGYGNTLGSATLGPSMLDLVGDTPLIRLQEDRARRARRRVVRQGRVDEPGWLGEGSAGAADDAGGDGLGRALAGRASSSMRRRATPASPTR